MPRMFRPGHSFAVITWFLITGVGVFFFTVCRPASSQQVIPKAAEGVNARNYAIWMTIRNEDGSSSELTASDLVVKIDNERVSVGIRRVRPTLRYCVLLDTSGSTRRTLEAQRNHIRELLSKIPQTGRDYGVLVAFADQPLVDAEGTDPEKLATSLNKENSRGATALSDAVFACSEDLSRNDPSKTAFDALRLMFIFSDGEDNASHVSRDKTESTVISDAVRVYSIAEEDPDNPHASEAAKGKDALKRLAEMSGGKYYSPGKKLSSAQIVADISGDLANLYAVTLASDKTLPEDHLHKVQVKCDKKNVVVTAPRQYLAAPN